MGKLVAGKWEMSPIVASDKQGHFVRPDSVFRNWITHDGSSQFQAEPNRYHVYVSYACPWASRVLIFLALKKLHSIISFSSVEPVMGDSRWEFGHEGSNTQDPLHNTRFLYELYQKADPHYTGKVTVPVLWDKHSNTIVNNESADIIRMLNSEFNDFTDNHYNYYPHQLHDQIDTINDFIYHNINNGVYKCGFATSQQAYEEAFDNLFSALDRVESILQRQPYLVGDSMTEADWRLFTTLIRFDVVYYLHFKCNLKRIDDYHYLPKYLRQLYQTPGIKTTVNFEHIKKHYYISHKMINPSGIVPKGPDINFDGPNPHCH